MLSKTAPDNTPDPIIEKHHRVLFQKPELPTLAESYTVVDLHFHSRYSDGFNSIDAIARRVRKLGIGIAITDHNTIGGALEIAKYTDILSIPGIEVTSKEGAHVLAYFYSTDELIDFYGKISPHLGKSTMTSCAMPMESILLCARAHNAVVVFPHPYCAAYTGVCNPIFSPRRQAELLAMADGVEVINAGNIHRWNLKSTVLGFNMNTSFSAGSDGHNLFQMGAAVTYADCGKTISAFLDALKERMTWTIGKEVGLLRKMTSNGMKIPSNICNSSDLLGKNIRYGAALINGTLESRKSRKKARVKLNAPIGF